MPGWKFFDWLTYALLALTAVLEALWAAADKLPDYSRQLPFLYANFWAYMPLVLISAATFIMAAKAVRHRWVPPAPPPGSGGATELATPAEQAFFLRDVPPPLEIPMLISPDGTPDTKLSAVYDYVLKGSVWSAQHVVSKPADTLLEIRDKLHMRKLTAWGRREPDGRLDPIPWKEWDKLRLYPMTGIASDDQDGRKWYGVQFDFGQVSSVWPPRRV